MAHISRRATLRVWLQERDARRVWVQDTLFVASAPSALLPIHEAARYWDVDQIQELISKGVNPDALDEPGGRTPLFFACCEESNFTAALSNDEGHADAQVACATALLRAGASAKAANVYGLGPIHCAAACRRAGARLVELLIIYGADPNQSTGGGRTPLHAAAQHGHAATVHALLRAGADANFRGRYGTALDLANCPPKITARAHRTRCRRVLPYLLRAGADQCTNLISRRFDTVCFVHRRESAEGVGVPLPAEGHGVRELRGLRVPPPRRAGQGVRPEVPGPARGARPPRAHVLGAPRLLLNPLNPPLLWKSKPVPSRWCDPPPPLRCW